MLPFIDVVTRAIEGPYCEENEFDLEVLNPKVSELIKKYKIKFDPDDLVPCDDDLADRVFKAGVELFTHVGVFCSDTRRLIKFTEDEVNAALMHAPNGSYFGEGKDRKKMVARKPDSDIPPWCFLGACAVTVSSDEIFFSLMKAYAENPLADSMTTPTIAMIDGRQVRSSTPLEILACMRSTRLARMALEAAGRPGLPLMNSIATASADISKIAGGQFGLRPSDGWQIGAFNEFKINMQRLNEIQYCLSSNCNINAEGGPVLGGMCGGPEGTAIATVAYHLLAILVLRGSSHLSFPINFSTICSSSRDLLWSVSLAVQAISRNSHFPIMIVPFTAAGPAEEMCFLEAAATITAIITSGASIEALATHKIVKTDLQSPIGPLFASEVAHSAVGMTRKEGKKIVNKLLAMYEKGLDNPPMGKTYQESYDVKTGRPFPETMETYEKAKKKISDLGLKFIY